MGSHAALLADALPPLVIETFTVERMRRPRPARVVADYSPPGSELIERLRRRYDLAIGAYRDFEPRMQSTVEHRVRRSADEVLVALRVDRTMYDRLEHEYRAPMDLHVAWSWPALPMWFSIGELSSTTCALRLSLRSRRRLRYPRRYFHAAHAALRDIERVLAR